MRVYQGCLLVPPAMGGYLATTQSNEIFTRDQLDAAGGQLGEGA